MLRILVRRLYREPREVLKGTVSGKVLHAAFLYCIFFFFCVVASYPGMLAIFEYVRIVPE